MRFRKEEIIDGRRSEKSMGRTFFRVGNFKKERKKIKMSEGIG